MRLFVSQPQRQYNLTFLVLIRFLYIRFKIYMDINIFRFIYINTYIYKGKLFSEEKCVVQAVIQKTELTAS